MVPIRNQTCTLHTLHSAFCCCLFSLGFRKIKLNIRCKCITLPHCCAEIIRTLSNYARLQRGCLSGRKLTYPAHTHTHVHNQFTSSKLNKLLLLMIFEMIVNARTQQFETCSAMITTCTYRAHNQRNDTMIMIYLE